MLHLPSPLSVQTRFTFTSHNACVAYYHSLTAFVTHLPLTFSGHSFVDVVVIDRSLVALPNLCYVHC